VAFTYFFRDFATLDLLAKHVTPAWRGKRFINIWDAGCAMGPEPFSLAIIIREHLGGFAFRNVKIHASDIDSSNLFGEIIRNAVYPYSQLKRIPRPIFEKYFIPAGDPNNSGQEHYRLRDEIRNSVTYTRHDLLSLKPLRRDLDLIVCKNVLLHFDREQRFDVIKMFHAALREGGCLAMEQTQLLPEELEPLFDRLCTNARIYRKTARRAAGNPPWGAAPPWTRPQAMP